MYLDNPLYCHKVHPVICGWWRWRYRKRKMLVSVTQRHSNLTLCLISFVAYLEDVTSNNRHPIHLPIEILNTRIIFSYFFPPSFATTRIVEAFVIVRRQTTRQEEQQPTSRFCFRFLQYVAWVMTLPEENHLFSCVQYSLQCCVSNYIQSSHSEAVDMALEKTVCSVTNGLDFGSTDERRRVVVSKESSQSEGKNSIQPNCGYIV